MNYMYSSKWPKLCSKTSPSSMDTASRKIYAVSRYNKIYGIILYNLIPQTINEWMNECTLDANARARFHWQKSEIPKLGRASAAAVCTFFHTWLCLGYPPEEAVQNCFSRLRGLLTQRRRNWALSIAIYHSTNHSKSKKSSATPL